MPREANEVTQANRPGLSGLLGQWLLPAWGSGAAVLNTSWSIHNKNAAVSNKKLATFSIEQSKLSDPVCELTSTLPHQHSFQ